MRIGPGIVAAFAAISLVGCGGGSKDGGAGLPADLVALVSQEQACVTAADCCVAIDGCLATAYVVAREDYERAVELAEQPGDACVDCISPAVELRCEAGSCIGVEIEDPTSAAYDANRGSHCGAASDGAGQALSADSIPAGRVFGCGAP